jgi:hypothetical protein
MLQKPIPPSTTAITIDLRFPGFVVSAIKQNDIHRVATHVPVQASII